MAESIQIVILNHGKFGEELIRSAELIVGGIEDICAISLVAGESLEEYSAAVKAKLVTVTQPTIVLVDLYGGTPSNVAMMLRQEFGFKIICGVNLPMLIELVLSRNTIGHPLNELIDTVYTSAKNSIFKPNELGEIEDEF